MGGVSIIIYSYCSERYSIKCFIFSDERSSEGFGGNVPVQITERGRLFSVKTSQSPIFARKSQIPCFDSMPHILRCMGLRISQSIRRVILPSIAKLIAIFAEVTLFPSPGLALVTANVLHCLFPSFVMQNRRPVLSFTYASFIANGESFVRSARPAA